MTRVCSYDRPGLGWSTGPAKAVTGIDIAQHLHQLFDQTGESGPFVMVGHSMGGAFVQIFTGLYPEEVLAVGLIDPTHPELFNRYPVKARIQKEAFSALIRVSSLLTHLGLIRATHVLSHPITDLPPEHYRAAKLFVSSAQHLVVSHRELAHWGVTMAYARQHMDLGDRPLTVISATETTSGLPDHYLEPLQQLHAELAETSTSSRHIKIPEANHFTIISKRKNAERTAQALKDLVQRARVKQHVEE